MPKKNKTGIDPSDIRKMLNDQVGDEVAFSLVGDNPTEVREWIPTGSKILDYTICKGNKAGIPVGRICSIAGLQSTGKSYMAIQIAAQAQKQGFLVVYFDSESAIQPDFLEQSGIDLSSFVYVQPRSVEHVFEMIEGVLAKQDRVLYIWDSLAFTPCDADKEKGYNPNSSIALKPRITALGMQKLTIPIGKSDSTLLVLNQLKTNIPSSHLDFEARQNPLVTPGGLAMKYAYSLEIWLTRRKAKSAFIEDENGFRVGCEVIAEMKKSRFGTEGRKAVFKIMWSNEQIGVADEEAWFDAIRYSDRVSWGAWNKLKLNSGEWTGNFRSSEWKEKLQDDEFRDSVEKILEYELIKKYELKEGSAEQFFSVEGEEEVFEAAKEEAD